MNYSEFKVACKRPVAKAFHRFMQSDWFRRTMSTIRTEDWVLRKYDQMGGATALNYARRLKAGEQIDAFYNGTRTRALPGEVLTAKHDFMANDVLRPLLSLGDTVLEVGAGELSTMSPLSKRLDDLDLEFHGLELSWSRLASGRILADVMGARIDTIVVGNAMALPYPDNAFDVVYTQHCLEQIPMGLEKAVDEICRVARKHVVLFEPSYALSHPEQRQRIRSKHYATGLDALLPAKGFPLLTHELVPNDISPDNRSAVHRINVQTPQTMSCEPALVCPECHGALNGKGEFLYCKTCGVAYPVLDGIPCLLPDKGVPASRLTTQEELRRELEQLLG